MEDNKTDGTSCHDYDSDSCVENDEKMSDQNSKSDADAKDTQVGSQPPIVPRQQERHIDKAVNSMTDTSEIGMNALRVTEVSDREATDQNLTADNHKDNTSNIPASTVNTPDCNTCEESKIKVQAVKLCMICNESFCDSCATVHRSQKATRHHELKEHSSPPGALFVCDTCAFVHTKTPATASCKECEELYCDTCTNVHRSQKATRTHSITMHTDLSEKTMCESCKYNGQDHKAAVCLCVECDEVQCTDCKSVHMKQKVTRGHTLILSTTSIDAFCHLCWKTGQQTTAEKYCKNCFLNLCSQCADAKYECYK